MKTKMAETDGTDAEYCTASFQQTLCYPSELNNPKDFFLSPWHSDTFDFRWTFNRKSN